MEKISFGSGASIPDPVSRYASQLIGGNYSANVHSGGADAFHGPRAGKKPNKLAQTVALGIAGVAAWRFGLFSKLANTKMLKNLHLEKKFGAAKSWITKTVGGLFGRGGAEAAKTTAKKTTRRAASGTARKAAARAPKAG